MALGVPRVQSEILPHDTFVLLSQMPVPQPYERIVHPRIYLVLAVLALHRLDPERFGCFD